MADSFLLLQGENGYQKAVKLKDNEDGTFSLATTADIKGDITVDVDTSVLEDIVAKESTLEIIKKSSIPEYMWLDTDDPKPDPGDDGFDRAMGVEIDTSTNEMNVKYWDGSEWKGVAE